MNAMRNPNKILQRSQRSLYKVQTLKQTLDSSTKPNRLKSSKLSLKNKLRQSWQKQNNYLSNPGDPDDSRNPRLNNIDVDTKMSSAFSTNQPVLQKPKSSLESLNKGPNTRNSQRFKKPGIT